MYTEIVVDNMHYFIATVNMADRTFDISERGRHTLLMMSDFVVDRNQNSVIKCRATMSEVIRGYCKSRGE